MESAVIAAIITAVSGIIIALLNHYLQKQKHKPKADEPKPIDRPASEIEQCLRQDERIQRLLNNANWKSAAEAAIQFYCNGIMSKTFKKTSTWNQVGEVYGELTAMAAETITADDLLAKLLRERRKISYGKAYEFLIGPRPNPWRNIPHASDVARLAGASSVQIHDGLSIRLDALVVNQEGQEPSNGHFKGNYGYTVEQWRAAFAD